jgi:hypothetical protein
MGRASPKFDTLVHVEMIAQEGVISEWMQQKM